MLLAHWVATITAATLTQPGQHPNGPGHWVATITAATLTQPGQHLKCAASNWVVAISAHSPGQGRGEWLPQDYKWHQDRSRGLC